MRHSSGIGSIDLVLVINLDRRVDRLNLMARQCKEAGISYVRFPAIDGRSIHPDALPLTKGFEWTPGAYANLLSQIAVLSLAKLSGSNNTLILEDDAVFPSDLPRIIDQLVTSVPDNWGMLLLGGWHMSNPVPIVPGIARAIRSLNSHAYIVRSTAIEPCLERLQTCLNYSDHSMSTVQATIPTYLPDNFTVHQAAGNSDIWYRLMDEKDGRVQVPEISHTNAL